MRSPTQDSVVDDIRLGSLPLWLIRIVVYSHIQSRLPQVETVNSSLQDVYVLYLRNRDSFRDPGVRLCVPRSEKQIVDPARSDTFRPLLLLSSFQARGSMVPMGVEEDGEHPTAGLGVS